MRIEIENRLVDFAAAVAKIRSSLDRNELSENLISQLSRSSSSAALNYGEALGAESRRDFIHKISLVLKEIRESHNNLRIISKSGLYKGEKKELDLLLDECNQLVAIFQKTSLTLKSKTQ
jgi:four helix bundle protein